MNQPFVTVEKFRSLAVVKLRFLEERGFTRMANLEKSGPTFGTVVYLGNHVGFVFSLDVRDQCVDAEVVKVQDGQLTGNEQGGYSSDIFAHFVYHEGYRGGFGSVSGKAKPSDYEVAIGRMIDGYVSLLKTAGAGLLKDDEASLP
jgi:hypothetical protein